MSTAHVKNSWPGTYPSIAPDYRLSQGEIVDASGKSYGHVDFGKDGFFVVLLKGRPAEVRAVIASGILEKALQRVDY